MGKSQSKNRAQKSLDSSSESFIGEKISFFSSQLYKSISSSKNLVFSPTSIYIALALAALGSNGTSLTEFMKVLQFENKSELAEETKQLQNNILTKSNDLTTLIANKLFVGLKEINQEYVDLVRQSFQTAVFENVDFSNSFEKIRVQINQWVQDVTQNKITNLLPIGSVSQLTKMVLVNAIYFKGKWNQEFSVEDTKKAPFKLEYEEQGKVVEVEMMNQVKKFVYYETRKYQYISLPYRDRTYQMEIILPKSSLSKFEQSMKDTIFSEPRKNLTFKKVNISLPKFKIEGQSIDLSTILKDIGLTLPFTDQADFSFMDASNSIQVNSVIHKAIIEVNEQGAEAAAATAVCMDSKGFSFFKEEEKIFVMNCNHPFLFSITHMPSKTQLFYGKITNPNQIQNIKV